MKVSRLLHKLEVNGQYVSVIVDALEKLGNLPDDHVITDQDWMAISVQNRLVMVKAFAALGVESLLTHE